MVEDDSESAPRRSKWTREQLHGGSTILCLQTGTNRFASQKGMTGFGSPRLNVSITKDKGFIEPDRKGEDILRVQMGTNKFASQKQMTAIGAIRNTKMRILVPEGMNPNQEKQTETILPMQSGSNKFASQGGEVVFFGKRNTSTRIRGRMPRDNKSNMVIPYQSGTNIFASQTGMHDPPGCGAFRQATTDIEGGFGEDQLRKSEHLIPFQAGTNVYDSQKGTGGFLKVRDVKCHTKDGKPISDEMLMQSEGIVRLQSGTNKFDSQKGMTGMGMPRDVLNKPRWKMEWVEEWEAAEQEWEDSGRGKLVDIQKQENAERIKLRSVAGSVTGSDKGEGSENETRSEEEEEEEEG